MLLEVKKKVLYEYIDELNKLQTSLITLPMTYTNYSDWKVINIIVDMDYKLNKHNVNQFNNDNNKYIKSLCTDYSKVYNNYFDNLNFFKNISCFYDIKSLQSISNEKQWISTFINSIMKFIKYVNYNNKLESNPVKYYDIACIKIRFFFFLLFYSCVLI